MSELSFLKAIDTAEAREALSGVTTIYTDLDGTLFSPGGKLLAAPDGTPSFATAEAIVALRNAGFQIVIVTGRNRFQCNEFVRLLDVDAAIGEMGCTYQARGAGELDYEYDTGTFEWDPERFRTPYEAIAASGAVDALLEEFAGRIEYNYPRCLNRDVTHAMRGLVDVEAVRSFFAREGYELSFEDNGALYALSPTLPECDVIHGYHIVPANTSKALAVRKDMARRGVDPAQAVAIGDGVGDVEVGRYTGAFVMMCNGLRDERSIRELESLSCNRIVTNSRSSEGWLEFANVLLGRAAGAQG
ncbi:MAG: HAD family hydrolase [Coriobacteriales bacterium]|jgi:HAD superfamily hydrolase (TIGR01484 family)